MSNSIPSLRLLAICSVVLTSASAQTVVYFDAPSARNTIATGINDQGVVTGYYSSSPDGFSNYSCFVRHTDGIFVYVSVPGAGSGISQGTFCRQINFAGVVTGNYTDSSDVSHGFIGFSGTISVFDAPGAGTGAGMGTFPLAINSEGAVVGYTVDSNQEYHAFVKTPLGLPHVFDYPGAGGAPYTGTQATGVNEDGVICGWYLNSAREGQGFIRPLGGPTFSFSAGGSSSTFVTSINKSGTVTGYIDSFAGFVRASHGTETTFAIGIETHPAEINNSGAIAGWYSYASGQDFSLTNKAFVRKPNGTVVAFGISGPFTPGFALGINASGATAGYYLDLDSFGHGMLLLP